MTSILFICTGNVFRSVVAEYALKAHLGTDSAYRIGSAGTEAPPQPLHPLIRDRLRARGADPSRHVQRRLTHELLTHADVAVAMGLDHRDFVRRHFGREVLLFNQVCYQREESVLDIHEAVPDWDANREKAYAYALSVVDYIWQAMPAFVAGLPRL